MLARRRVPRSERVEAILELARAAGRSGCSAKEVCEAQEVSQPYGELILSELLAEGLLERFAPGGDGRLRRYRIPGAPA